MLQVEARLAERQVYGANQELRLESPALAAQLSAGQAVLVRTSWGLDPYLRRTFYPVAVDAEGWTLRLPASGDRGHAWLRLAPVGISIDCLGPVGVGFQIPGRIRQLLCLGEGDLAWTLLPVVRAAETQGLAVTLAAESTTAAAAIPAQRLPLSVEYRSLTRAGGKERLSDLLADTVGWADAIVAAGSLTFYQQLAESIRQRRVVLSRGFAQVLYPATFLCGVGACLACAADVAGGRRRVCLRGPVFDLLDVTP